MNPNEHATRAGGTTERLLPDEVEVAVVGAGPAGLTLAGILSGYGIRTAVLDSAAGPARHSRAAIVHARTLETLKSLDVVGEMLDGGVVVTHFGVRARLLLGVDFDGLPTAHPYTLMLPQDRTERILLGTLRERGGCGPATSSAATAGTASRGELSAYRSRARPTPSPSCLRTCA